MKVDTGKIRELCRERQLSVDGLLRQAGVSRNAYYALARKKSILPRSLRTLAEFLDVSPSAFLAAESSPGEKSRELVARVEQIVRRHPEADPDNIRHTLLLLREEPADRLKRAILRAQKFDFR